MNFMTSNILGMGIWLIWKNIATKVGNVRLLIIDNTDWLVVWNMAFMTFDILGMSSSQLTNSIIFQRVETTNQ